MITEKLSQKGLWITKVKEEAHGKIFMLQERSRLKVSMIIITGQGDGSSSAKMVKWNKVVIITGEG